jgi:dTDP-4-dehydrorhamnose reductase
VDKRDLKILILGHNGMLGRTVCWLLKSKGFTIETINERWPSKNFKDKILNCDCDFIINCIASIPQKNKSAKKFKSNNFDLPVFVSKNFNGKIIHPASDIEYSNDQNPYSSYKRKASIELAANKNVYIICSSLIGPEKESSYCLWSWLESQKNKDINGYINHLWNGITTLEFSKICFKILKGKINKKLIKAGTKTISKYKLLKILNKKLKIKAKIKPIKAENEKIKPLEIDYKTKKIELQIEELIKSEFLKKK